MLPNRNGNLSEMPLQEFVLDGFEGGLQAQALLFALFLALYVVAILGNVTIPVCTPQCTSSLRTSPS